MQDLDAFFLSLHAAAREVPFERFQEHALSLLKRLVPFDIARWGTACRDERGVDFHAPYLYNDTLETLEDYAACRELDRAARWCLDNLDVVLNSNLRALYSPSTNPALLQYVERYRHVQGLIVGHRDDDTGLHQAISLYGAYEHKPFNEDQRRTLEVAFPHLREALKTSHAFQMERMRPRNGDVKWSLAICDAAGYFRYVEPLFLDMLRHEWPNLLHRTLPRDLVYLIRAQGEPRWRGRMVLFYVEHVCNAVFVRARSRLPVDDLSPRELGVARLVAAGRTHKEIAKLLGIAPATVRNHLQAIHECAGVHTNAELVQQLKRVDC
ncbi:LuxR family transcriptional regulator [Paraburkholderia unamae]|uniref:helix-turn-helix transcriptional regulator n=1 Tax=Paraburkholderia unamae TaxID=219649 RepID=UPI000DC26C2B|nr:helix-turn-helix transcriptional regulator [Paraburkholderia unamae]RAR59202.1 LuxR family transcriptional regulator [Paraburkholderia unamae]